MFSRLVIKAEYFKEHPYGVDPVQLNDVIFSVHAVFACLVTIFQCYIYERGNQVYGGEIRQTGESYFYFCAHLFFRPSPARAA